MLRGRKTNDSGDQTTTFFNLDVLCRRPQNPKNGIGAEAADTVSHYVFRHL